MVVAFSSIDPGSDLLVPADSVPDSVLDRWFLLPSDCDSADRSRFGCSGLIRNMFKSDLLA